MAQRILPGAYVTLNDMSQAPEGQTALTVGYVLKANRGPVNELQLVTSPTDFLTKYTFSGKPGISSDPTFWSILKVLPWTNSVYVSRAANDPLYGAAVIKASEEIGTVTRVNRKNKVFVFSGDISSKVKAGDSILVYNTIGNTRTNGTYMVDAVAVPAGTEVHTNVRVKSDVPLGGPIEQLGAVKGYQREEVTVSGQEPTYTYRIWISGTNVGAFKVGQVISIENSSVLVGENCNTEFTVRSASYSSSRDAIGVRVNQSIYKDDTSYAMIEETGNAIAYDIVDDLSNAKGYICSCSVSDKSIAPVSSWATGQRIVLAGNAERYLSLGSKFKVSGCSVEGNNTVYTVETNEEADPIHYDIVTNTTTVIVKESFSIPEEMGSLGTTYYVGLVEPSDYPLDENNMDEIMLITGKDPGAYNNDIGIEIRTPVDYPNDFVYVKGASIGGKICTFDTMSITVINTNTNDVLESFVFSRDPEAKTIDGISLYVDNVVAGSAYIKVINNTKAYDVDDDGNIVYTLPKSTLAGWLTLGGGCDGGDVTVADLEAALEPFKEKTQTLSILGNGCSVQAEQAEFQQALMGVANERKDLIVFLNNPKETENRTLNSMKAQAIVDYKKATGEYGTAQNPGLGSTSFYGCMYAPHVSTSDTFNQRQVKIGAEAVAIAGWLDVINNLGYPYAYAGPRNGLVQGVTCDWKIGDMSAEAEILNDASVNYVAYDGKVGRYYMQCQNTLQIANSSLRNIGTVFNILDIKEHFVTLLKEYLQLPITDDLRREIIDVSNDYLSPMLGVRFSNYSFQDVTRDIDLADNTLRYLLTIAPTPYAQKIFLTMNIVNATFDFSILQSL